MIYNNVLDLIGETPIIKLNFEEENIADIYLKLENFNLSGSVKDRAALGMIEKAEKEGLLKKGGTIVEPTSGNTGIALAAIGKAKGYKVIITMPETMSLERRTILKAYGAELILTNGDEGMSGAILKAEKLANENPDYFLPHQFKNEANPNKHYETTAIEILKDFDNLDVFIAGVGTGGTLIGVGRRLKENFKNIKLIAVEPTNSAVLSAEHPGTHLIQGIGAGFIPKIYDKNIVDEIVKVSDEDAIKFTKKLSQEQSLFVGISSGANVFAAYTLAKSLGKGKKILTIAPDGGEKYLSVEYFES